jgi:hypothetical protein
VKLDQNFKSINDSEKGVPGGAVLTNIAVGWGSMAVGALIGLVLGLWSFGGPVPVPELLGEYDSLPRRLMRLGHIAFFGLGILNILMAVHLGRLNPRDRLAKLALLAMNFGNVFLPLTLICAAFFEPLKYLMSLPATAVTFALIISAHTAIHAARKERE